MEVMSTLRKLVIIVSIVILMCFEGFSALRVNPLLARVSVLRGKKADIIFHLKNTSQNSMGVDVEKRDFYVNSNGIYITGIATPAYAHSCRKWLSLSNTSITLFPGEDIDIPITINVPFTAAGEYFAGINFSYVLGKQIESGFRVVMNIFCIIIIDVKNSTYTYKAKFRSSDVYKTSTDQLPKDFPASLKKYPYVFKIEYANEGNTVIGLDGQMRVISNTLHRLMGTFQLSRQDTIAFPAITRVVWLPSERLLPNGDYRAMLSADLGNHHMTSNVFEFKITNAEVNQKPAFKCDISAIEIPLKRPRVFVGRDLKIESLDFRKLNISARITGFKQRTDGTLVPTVLNKAIIRDMKVYPKPIIVYPYRERSVRIVGKAPEQLPEAGEYYALLNLNAAISKGASKTISIPMIFSVGKTTKSIALDNLICTPAGTKTEVSFDVKNTGNSYVDFSGYLLALDKNGRSILPQPVSMNKNRVYTGFTLHQKVVIPTRIEKGGTVRVVLRYVFEKDAEGKPIYKTVSTQERF